MLLCIVGKKLNLVIRSCIRVRACWYKCLNYRTGLEKLATAISHHSMRPWRHSVSAPLGQSGHSNFAPFSQFTAALGARSIYRSFPCRRVIHSRAIPNRAKEITDKLGRRLVINSAAAKLFAASAAALWFLQQPNSGVHAHQVLLKSVRVFSNGIILAQIPRHVRSMLVALGSAKTARGLKTS